MLAKDRGMWVWNTRDILKDIVQENRLISQCTQAYVTDVYLYLVAEDYIILASSIQQLVTNLATAGIRAWGLEGWRGYFSDAYGPAKYYAAIDAMIAYNAKVPASAKLVGFHADMEPNDGQGAEFKTTFHNAFKDSQLSSASGSGVWKDTQVHDRDYLMQDWVAIFQTTKTKLLGLKFAASMPSWVGDFYGEPVHVTLNGVRQPLMPVMMSLIDSYVIMSYSTNPAAVVAKMTAALTYADANLLFGTKIYASLDCHAGDGVNESYGDTPGKQSKLALMTDIAAIHSLLRQYKSLSGVCIHDWSGWDGLS